jgi:hypothetical protein
MSPLALVPIAVGVGLIGLALSSQGAGKRPVKISWRKVVYISDRQPFTVLVLGASRDRALLYLHGNGAHAEEIAPAIAVLTTKAKRPPMVILPQLAPDGNFLPFKVLGGLSNLLKAVGAGNKKLDVVAHSGGYLAAANGLHGSELKVSGIVLLDALYARSEVFGLRAQMGTRLIDIYGPTTAAQSLVLASQLRAKLGEGAVELADYGIGSTLLSKVAASKRATFVRSDVEHSQMPSRYLTEVIDAL